MKKLIAFACLLFAALCAFAQPPGTHPSYVPIMRASKPLDALPMAQAVCGGVVVHEKRKLIATAWHCVPNDEMLLASLSVNGSAVKLISFSPEADMAIFQVADLKGAKAPKFATPKIGETISAYAYFDSFPVVIQPQIADRAYPAMSIQATLSWKGDVMAIATANKRAGPNFDQIVRTEFKWIVVPSNPTQGFSGAPMFDKDGNFVGIISNGNGGFTNVSSSENVLSMLKKMP